MIITLYIYLVIYLLLLVVLIDLLGSMKTHNSILIIVKEYTQSKFHYCIMLVFIVYYIFTS